MTHWIFAALAAILITTFFFRKEIATALNRIVDVEQESIAQMEWRKELVLHAAFYGAAIAGLLGFQHDSLWTKLIAALWFVAGLWLARRYANIIHEKEEIAEGVRWRKLAGMIRSVTRSEIERKYTSAGQNASGKGIAKGEFRD